MNQESLGELLKARKYVCIQMTRSAVGHFQVQAEIDGYGVLLLVDTGASKTVIHDATAERMGIKIENSVDCGGGLGTSQAAVSTTVARVFRLGALELNEFPLFIMDFSHVIDGIGAKGGQAIDGVVGGDILGAGSAIIDYEEAKLYLKSFRLPNT